MLSSTRSVLEVQSVDPRWKDTFAKKGCRLSGPNAKDFARPLIGGQFGPSPQSQSGGI